MIQVRDTDFPEAKLYLPVVHTDGRGFFKETYSKNKYDALGMADEWVQDSVSWSARNVLRGMHYDVRMAKLVQVLHGAVFDVIADLRPESANFKKWQSFDLSAANHRQLYVPKGFAHGFLALTDDVIFHYKMSAHYDPEYERTLSWKDSSVGIRWPLQGEPILSAKDAAA